MAAGRQTAAEGTQVKDLFEGLAGVATGGASGIGRSVCLAIASRGGRLLAVDRDRGGLETVAGAAAGRVETLVCDLTDPDSHERYVAEATSRLGGIDFLFNNAGIEGPRKPLTDISLAEWDETIEVNLRACFLTLRAVVPAMRKRGGGQILNMASCLGVMGAAGTSAYSASKHAVVGLTRCTAAEEAANGITVNCIAPGPVETPLHDRAEARIEPSDRAKARRSLEAMIPIERFGEPAEIADVALFLLSPGHPYLTGATVSVDGGMTSVLHRSQ